MLTDAERKRADFVLWTFYVLVICGFMLGVHFVIVALQEHALAPHEVATLITAQSNWLPGESKDCQSATLDANAAAKVRKPIGYALAMIACDDGPTHSMKVQFYGKTVQPEYKVVLWHCTRNDNEFTCKQTGGIALDSRQ